MWVSCQCLKFDFVYFRILFFLNRRNFNTLKCNSVCKLNVYRDWDIFNLTWWTFNVHHVISMGKNGHFVFRYKRSPKQYYVKSYLKARLNVCLENPIKPYIGWREALQKVVYVSWERKGIFCSTFFALCSICKFFLFTTKYWKWQEAVKNFQTIVLFRTCISLLFIITLLYKTKGCHSCYACTVVYSMKTSKMWFLNTVAIPLVGSSNAMGWIIFWISIA